MVDPLPFVPTERPRTFATQHMLEVAEVVAEASDEAKARRRRLREAQLARLRNHRLNRVHHHHHHMHHHLIAPKGEAGVRTGARSADGAAAASRPRLAAPPGIVYMEVCSCSIAFLAFLVHLYFRTTLSVCGFYSSLLMYFFACSSDLSCVLYSQGWVDDFEQCITNLLVQAQSITQDMAEFAVRLHQIDIEIGVTVKGMLMHPPPCLCVFVCAHFRLWSGMR